MTSFLAQAAAPAERTHAALLMFLAFVAATLVITYVSARKSSGSSAYFAAGRRIRGWQNGLAVAGDYMSAASFLGIAGMIAFFGYDGFMYSVGWLVAYLTVLIIVAEPLRNAGKYTMADLLAYRLKQRPVRAMASLSTITVSTFYMIAQMVGAGALVKLLLPGVSFNVAVCGVGILMIIYVVFGGMLATTWVQIIKAVLLMGGSILLSIMVMGHFGFSFAAFFEAISHVTYHVKGQEVTQNFLEPGLKFGAAVTNGWGPLDLVSLGLALVFGTAGLPHILVRFYTVPDAKTARVSVVWAMLIIGAVLYNDDLPWLRCRHDSHPGPHCRRWQAQRQHGCSAPRSGARRRNLLRLHFCGRVCDHPGSGFGPDYLSEHFVRARFLYKCHPPRQGAGSG